MLRERDIKDYRKYGKKADEIGFPNIENMINKFIADRAELLEILKVYQDGDREWSISMNAAESDIAKLQTEVERLTKKVINQRAEISRLHGDVRCLRSALVSAFGPDLEPRLLLESVCEALDSVTVPEIDDIRARYPEKWPAALNYRKVREDIELLTGVIINVQKALANAERETK